MPRKTASKSAASRVSRTWQLAGLAVVSGALIVLATADFDVWPLAWVALVPLLFAIDNAPTRRHAVLLGWLAGTTANAGGFYWITGLLVRYGHFPWVAAFPCLLLLSAYQGLVFLGLAWLVRTLRARRRALPMVLLAPLALVTCELIVPFIFPWYLAITQAWQPVVIQIADITGPLGVSAVLACASGALYDAWTERGRRRWALLSCGAGVVAATLVYGAVRMSQVASARERAPSLRVGLVQPNVGFDEKANRDRDDALRELAELQDQSARLEARGADLIVWPESSYPFAISRDRERDFPESAPFRIRRGFRAPLVFGTITAGARSSDPYNSALLLSGDDLAGRADKNFLLMFGEYVPFAETFPFLTELMPPAAGQFQAGDEPGVLTLASGARLGIMICYEDILPRFGRELSAREPDLLVNVTNDAWFGDTSEPWEHLALSVFRAIEVRNDLVRAVNTGVSAIIHADGRLARSTYAVDPGVEPRGADGIVGEVRLHRGGQTIFARVGDAFGYSCVLILAAISFVTRRSKMNDMC